MAAAPNLFSFLSTFAAYNSASNQSAAEHTDYRHDFALPFERLEHTQAITLFLQRHWHYSLYLSLAYFVGFRLLEWAMRSRPRLELRGPLIAWNCALALFSLFGFVRFAEDTLHQLSHHGLAFTVCHPCHPNRVAAFWAFMFLLSKVVELGDTLFLVLRKKPIIFLHYYHHMAVLVCSTHVGADNAAPAMLFIPMNFFVHVLMYSYYALSAYGIKMPRPIAMCITSLQTVQMLCGVALTAFVLKLKLIDGKRCQQSYGNLSLIVFLYITFAILFSHLFYDHYIKKKEKKEGEQMKKKKKL